EHSESWREQRGKRERRSIKLTPLTADRLGEALTLLHAIFPSIGSTEESPEMALPASLDPKKYEKELGDWGISSLNYWLAQDGGKAIGVTGLYSKTADTEATAWLGWYGLAPDQRGNGAGRQILEATVDKARSNGVKELRLYTTDEDDPLALK